ncbi:hypothetical protein ACQJBY_011714 [Aegilops geniculata]
MKNIGGSSCSARSGSSWEMSKHLDCMNHGHTRQLAWLNSSDLTTCLEYSLRVPLLVWFRTWLRKGCQGSSGPGLEHEGPVGPAMLGLERLQHQRNVQHICHYFFLEMPPPIVKFNINGPILISNCKNRMPTEANDIQLSNNLMS